LSVELVRVVEDGSLGSSRGGAVVVRGDRVQELAPDRRVEIPGALLDETKPEMNVTEQATLLGLAERWASFELPHPADVVEERGREQEVCAKARVELSGLAGQRRHTDRVLE
jgi:hypothetical protein